MNKIFLKSLGCKVNLYENNSIFEIFSKNGFIFDEKDPDVCVINTCSVTSISDRKSRKFINYYRKLFPKAVLIVVGCYVQGIDDTQYSSINCDIIIGNSYKSKIYDLYKEFLTEKRKIIRVEKTHEKIKYDEIAFLKNFNHTRAYVKIQDGCDKYCSYCLIPYIRLRSRSRNKENIFCEIENLLNNNFKEIVLTGIDVSSYGLDLYSNYTFSDLLEEILDKFPNLYRIRISSIEESMIDDKFLHLLKDDRVAKHLHLSLQSGSDFVLKKMNRRYDSSSFYEKISKIYESVPDINITTDVIVGFPGETEENFIETYNFVKKCKFSKVHVFPYSDRKGTVASKLSNKVSPQVKKERVARLMNLSKILEEAYLNKFLNKDCSFLIEQFDEKNSLYKGHSSNYLELNIKGEKGNYKINETYNFKVSFDNVKIV